MDAMRGGLCVPSMYSPISTQHIHLRYMIGEFRKNKILLAVKLFSVSISSHSTP
jgi:hypothetical protein